MTGPEPKIQIYLAGTRIPGAEITEGPRELIENHHKKQKKRKNYLASAPPLALQPSSGPPLANSSWKPEAKEPGNRQGRLGNVVPWHTERGQVKGKADK